MPLDFPSQIVKPPQVLSYLLCSGRYSCFSHFTSFSCCVSRCVSPFCLPGAAFATAHRPDRSEQWSCGGEQFQAPPWWDTTGAIDFPSQIVKSPQVLSHLLSVVAIFPLPHPCAIRFPKSNRQTPTSPISSALQWSLFSFFSIYIIFLLCLPLCLSVVSPRVCNCWPSSPFWAVKLWGRAIPSASPVRHNGCHRFPKSKRQINTHIISSAFGGRYFFPWPRPCATRFPRPNPHKSYLICFAVVAIHIFPHFTSFSCCVSRCASPLCLPGEAFATADRPALSEQWSFGGEQFQAPPWWDTTCAIDFPSQIVKSPQILSHLLLVVAIFPLPNPCAIRFPKSNRQTPTSPISSALQWSLFSFFSFYIIFLLCLPLCLSVLPPWGRVCNCSPSRPFWAVKLWGPAVPSASPVRHNGCHRFPKSNRQISTSPISSAFSGRYFSLAIPMCH